MKPLLLLAVVGSMRVHAALPNACAPVEHDPINAGDLAAFLPALARLSPSTPVAPAPGPGVRRVFRSFELMALARNHSVELTTADDLCFELPMEALGRDRLLDAMQAALPLPGIRIEILETSLYPVPRGRIEFRREDLGAPALPASPSPITWRGNVVYGANQRFGIWARVRVTARLSRVIAAEPIKQGKLIAAGQIRMESSDVFPGPGDTASSVDQVAGRVAVRNLAAGAEIRLSHLESQQDVKRGDTVEVEVRSGAARLALTGKSESDGRTGDTITVRNLRSNKIFSARVNGKDRAFVEAGAPQGN